MKKSNISTMAELDAAQRQVNRDLRAKQKDLGRHFDSAKEFYTPSNMVNSFMTDISPIFDWRAMALSIIQGIRSKL